MTVVTAVLAVAAAPLVVAVLVIALRRPLHVLLPVYAATVPFGNGLAVPGLPDSIFSASSITGLLLTAVLGVQLVAGRRGPREVPLTVPAWLLFLAVTALTTYWTLSRSVTLESFAVTLVLVALYVAVRMSHVDAAVLARFEAGILAGGLAASLYGLYQLVTGSFVVGVGGDVRFGRDLIDPNHLAANLLLPLSVALARGSAPGRVLHRTGYLLLAALLLVSIVLTGSRGGVLGVGAVLLALALTSARPVRVLASGTAVIGVIVGLVLAFPTAVNDRLYDDGSSGRTGIWKVGLNGCERYCVAGAGWGTFGLVYEEMLPHTPDASTLRDPRMGAHNIYLGTVVEGGVAALLLLVTALGLTVREAARIPRALRAPPVAALAGLLFTSMLLGNLRFKYFWLVLLYVGVAHAVHARSPRQGGVPTSPPAVSAAVGPR
ncbi:MAG: O-antigen ligase family protein [Actinomycetes bacterium]